VGVVASAQLLDLDPPRFGQALGREPCAVGHALADHPLLTLEAIADLADRFDGRIERHRADLPVVAPGGAPELEGPPSETVRGIEGNGCWMVFWYLDAQPEYRALLDACLDEAEAALPAGAGPAVQREAFLFLSAPDAVTPVHFDPEHNFLLQIRGRKEMHVMAFASAADEQRELDRYFDGGHRNLEAMPRDERTFVLDPGDGVYVPSFRPHWVRNGPRASVSLSITFRTPESRRAERVHQVNGRLRRLRLSPRPPGVSPALDRAKESAWLALRAPREPLRGVRRALGGARGDAG
jgi:cupin superfamily protein